MPKRRIRTRQQLDAEAVLAASDRQLADETGLDTADVAAVSRIANVSKTSDGSSYELGAPEYGYTDIDGNEYISQHQAVVQEVSISNGTVKVSAMAGDGTVIDMKMSAASYDELQRTGSVYPGDVIGVRRFLYSNEDGYPAVGTAISME